MRLVIATTLALFMLTISSVAGAYEMTLVATSGTPSNAQVGDLLVYDVFLDTTNTTGSSGITLLSVGMVFDKTLLGYASQQSDTEDYYPLFSAKGVDGPGPAVWLNPISDPPALWNVAPYDQVNVDFAEAGLTATRASDTNLYLGTVAFNVIGTGTGVLTFDFSNSGNVFSLSGINIADPSYAGPESLTTVNTEGAIIVPEPGLAALAMGALGTVGLLYSRRRSD